MSMTLSEALSGLNVDRLRERITLLRDATGMGTPTTGTRKAELQAFLSQQLLDPAVIEGLWAKLTPLDRQFIAAALERGGQPEPRAFAAQFGRLPESIGTRRKYSHMSVNLKLLNLFFYTPPWAFNDDPLNGVQSLPSELGPLLEQLAPEPERFQLTGSKSVPESLEFENGAGQITQILVLRADTEVAGWHDLRVYLRLVQAGQLKFRVKGRDLTAGSVRKLLANLLDGDLLDLGDTIRDSIRPYGLDVFSRGAGLLRGDTLSPRGRAVLAGDVEALREGFEEWIEKGADEFARVRGVKGQGARRTRLIPAVERREQVVEALSWSPVGTWIHVNEFWRALKAWQFDFAVAAPDSTGTLYVGDGYHGTIEASSEEGWATLQGSYINTLLFEVLAPMGAVDVTYIPSEQVDSSWRDAGIDARLSLGEGLLHFRITPLGAWLFGQASSYQPPRTYSFDVTADLTLTLQGTSTLELQRQLQLIAVPVGTADEPGQHYRLDSVTLLASLEQGSELPEIRQFLQDGTTAELPIEAEAWLDELESNRKAVRLTDNAIILRVHSQAALDLINNDPGLLKAVYAVVGDTIVIPAKREAAFRRVLRQNGYGIS